jgi:glutamate/tyrosine decarboxylase-like PLP-dependent enzyme
MHTHILDDAVPVDDAATALARLAEDGQPSSAEAFLRLAVDYLAAAGQGNAPAATPLTQEQLAARFDEPMPVVGDTLDAVVRRLERDVVADTLRFQHPRYMGHQAGPPLPAAVWTEMVIGALNQALTVAEMSPSATALEARVVRWLAGLAGLPASAGGTLTSGGTEATFTALLAARAHALPRAWRDGLPVDAPVVVCGENAHYTTVRAAAQLGLGTRRVVSVPLRDWRMDVDALATTLAELRRRGDRVMAVVATAGATATGSFDDLEAVAELSEAYGAWMHVDGAHGSTALLSPTHRHRMRGVSRARTLAWNPHKAMMLPFAAGVLLARDERDLDAAFAQDAPYLLGESRGARTPDGAVRSFLCARRADVLKLWVALQRYGVAGLGALYDRMCALASGLYDLVRASEDFEALHIPECNIFCFRWIGTTRRTEVELDWINAAMRERYNMSGEGWITSTLLGGRRVLRVTTSNPRTSGSDLEALLAGLRAHAKPIADGR